VANIEHAKIQPTPQAPARRLNGQFAPGHSGNPTGYKAFIARQQAIRAQADALLKALRDELGSKVSAVDIALAQSAALMLAKATVNEKHRVTLTGRAQRIIDGLRERYPARKRLPTLRELGIE